MNFKAYTDPIVGRRVKVTGPGYYKGRCVGQTGVIKAIWNTDHVCVSLDFMANPNSGKGYFYFKLSELDFIETETTKTATAAEKEVKEMQKMTNYFNVADVQFLDDATCFKHYLVANYDPELAVGDLSIVRVNDGALRLAEVEEIHNESEEDLYSEVVCRVDLSAYSARVEKRKRTAELKDKMQARAKQLQDLVLYQTLAKEDPEMAALLNDFKELNN